MYTTFYFEKSFFNSARYAGICFLFDIVRFASVTVLKHMIPPLNDLSSSDISCYLSLSTIFDFFLVECIPCVLDD